MIKRHFAVFLILVCQISCVARPDLDKQPIAERNIAAKAAAMAGASVLDVDRYTPSTTVAGCPEKHEFAIRKTENRSLGSALGQAQAYSESQNGLALLVLLDGAIVYEQYGANVSLQSRTESFSMMKTVTALVTGIAIDEGVVKSVDDPVGDYLQEWAEDPRGQITIRQLLSMNSGLKHYPFGAPDGKIEMLLYSTDINAVALEYPVAGPPGNAFKYNNANSQLVGAVVDRALKQKGGSGFAAFLQKYLWCPLGNDKAGLWMDREGGSPHYFAGMQANARDWARVGELLRNQGRAGNQQIVPQAWIEAMLQPSETNPAYGLHIWRGEAWQKIRKYDPASNFGVLHSKPYLADDVYFLDGFGGQRVYIVPSRRLTIVRTGEVSMTYDDSIIVNLILSALGKVDP